MSVMSCYIQVAGASLEIWDTAQLQGQ